MFKFIRPKFLPLIVTGSGFLGLILRLWTIGNGPDANNLYARQPVAWNLLWMLTLLVLAVSLIFLHRLKTPGQYHDSFPASPISAGGCGLAAVGIACTVPALMTAQNDSFSSFAGLAGFVAAAAMAYVAYCRFQGTKPSFAAHLSVALFMALRVFIHCRIWSNEPQLGVFLFPLLAMIFLMLASFQFSCFDADMAKRRSCLFWSLGGVYFSMVALAGSGDLAFYGCMILWLITNLPSLRSLRTPPMQEILTEEPENPET